MRSPLLALVASAILLVLTASPPAHGQVAFDPGKCANTVAPYLEEDAIVVGRIDLRRFDVKAAAKGFGRLIPPTYEQPKPERFEQLKRMLTQGGADEVYVVMSLADLPNNGPFFILPLAGGKDPDALAAVMRKIIPQPFACEAWDKVVFLGQKASLARLRKRDAPAARAEMAKAFAAAGDAAVQLLLLPSDDHRRVVDEMIPRLPPGLGGGTTKPLTEGFRFAAVGIDVAPSLSVRLTVQAKDAAAAAAQRELAVKLFAFLGEHPQVKKLVPEFAELSKPLLPRRAGDRLILELNDRNNGTAALLPVSRPFLVAAQVRAEQHEIFNSLKQIGIAMHNYHDVNEKFPAAANYDKDGKPLLSWRVHILPYVEGEKLYKQFRLNEPWDSAHNKKLITRMPAVYRSSQGKLKLGHTTFLAPIGKNTVFSGKKGVSFRQIIDGTSNTVMILQAPDASAVPWTKPADWQFDPKKPLKGLFETPQTFSAVLCDGSAHRFNKDLKAETFRRMIIRNDGMPLP